MVAASALSHPFLPTQVPFLSPTLPLSPFSLIVQVSCVIWSNWLHLNSRILMLLKTRGCVCWRCVSVACICVHSIGLILGTGKWSAFTYGIRGLDMRSCKGIYGRPFTLACEENNLQDFTRSFIGACWWLLKIRWQQMIDPFLSTLPYLLARKRRREE